MSTPASSSGIPAGGAPGNDGSPDPGCVNRRWGLALLEGLRRAGLRTLVLSPGSRSTPVVIAAQRLPGIELVPILDERSAAFFALGAARASRRPVAVLATSGSAPAHWYPAVIEASAAGVPLVLLSADRPPRLRGWGASQTIDQTRLLGAFVREFHDPGTPLAGPAALKSIHALGLRAGRQSLEPRPGPVHLNLPFDEPLVPAGDCPPPAAPDLAAPGAAGTGPSPAIGTVPLELPAGRGLICCGPGQLGDDLAAALRDAAQALGLPLLADPLSGLRFGPAPGPVVSRYDALLRNAGAARALRPDWVLHIGGTPVSKRLGQWLEGVPRILVDAGGGWTDPTHDVVQRLCADPASVCRALARHGSRPPALGWQARWLAADGKAAALARQHLDTAPWCEGQLIRDLLGRIPAGEALLCANSMPIRQLDTWSGCRTAPLILHGNRGVSGIDGQLSTLAGLSHGGPPCWALLGDLSLCHDLSGLLVAGRLRRPLVVIDNGGGRIFDYLPQRDLPGFEALWRAPVEIDIAALAAAAGLPHRHIDTEADWTRALDELSHAPVLLQVRIDGDLSRRMHEDYWRLVAAEPALAAP